MSQPTPDPPDASAQPTPDEIRTELARVLASQCFAQAARSSEFLRYVVEQSLAGGAERLKGYTIALEVFKRPETFDAQSDPLVRVEAGRLRRRLLEYYVAEGYENALRIDLPRGGYAPEFRYAESRSARSASATQTLGTDAHVAPAREPRDRFGSRWRRLRTLAVIGVIVVLAALVVVQRLDRSAATPASAPNRSLALPSGPRIVVLPFENLSGDPSLDYFAAGVTEEIMIRLSAFNLFVIASPTTGVRGAPQASSTLPADVDALYVLTGGVRTTRERVRISARLVERATDAQLWTSAFDEDLTVETLLAIQERIAVEVARTISVPYGPIFDRELARAARKPAEHLDTYDCVLKYYAYRRSFDPPTAHAAALSCFRNAVAREPSFADAWGGLALIYLDEYAFGYDVQADARGPLERAREAARTGLDIDGDNYFSNLALLRVRFFSGDLNGFAHSADKVLALDPNNSETLALLGILFALSGTPDRAAALAAKATALAPRPPGNYYVAHALLDLRAGRAEDALAEALRVDAPNWFVSPMLVAASAGLAGRADIAQRAVERLLELYPSFPTAAGGELAKWQIDAQLRAQLDKGFRAAGIEIQ